MGWAQRHKVPIEVNDNRVEVRDLLFLNILIEEKMMVEVKVPEKDNPIHQVQLLTYLSLTGLHQSS
jgi:GxxExxY protein